jgi:hypothetical protein
MAGLDPAIHVIQLGWCLRVDVDARIKSGPDGVFDYSSLRSAALKTPFQRQKLSVIPGGAETRNPWQNRNSGGHGFPLTR